MEQRITASQVVKHFRALGTESGQPQINLQGAAMTPLPREKLAQINEHFDVTRVARENSLEKLDLEIKLRTLAKGSQPATVCRAVVCEIGALLILARRHCGIPMESRPILMWCFCGKTLPRFPQSSLLTPLYAPLRFGQSTTGEKDR